jgi:predicted translin family RNA/ssDNA-binding protein
MKREREREREGQMMQGLNKGCVTLWPLPFTLKSILRQKKNYGNSNISQCKNIIFKKPC